MWNRRDVFAAVGTGAAGLALLSGRSRAAAGQGPARVASDGKHNHEHSKMMKDCEEACGHCAATCNTTFHHCVSLAASGHSDHAKAAQILADCAAFCTLSAAMIARSSPLMYVSCQSCAEACNHCAQECERFHESDEMKTCGEACRRCEKSCREMVQTGHEHASKHERSTATQ